MSSYLVEGLEGKVSLFPDLLQQVTTDVVSGVKATPQVDKRWLVKNFVEVVGESIESNRKQYCAGGEYFEGMKAIQGKAFTNLPFKERFSAVAQIYSLTNLQKRELALNRIAELYSLFHQTEPTAWDATQKAWQAFVEASQVFSCFTINSRLTGKVTLHDATFPDWFLTGNDFIGLPALNFHSYSSSPNLDSNAALMNTQLQTQMAKEIGILAPEESWSDFIKRANIKIIGFHDQVRPEDKEMIIGRRDLNYSLGGRAGSYDNIGSKYPEMVTKVSFDTHYDRSGLYDQRLEELIDQGIVSPRMTLKIPTSILLSIDK